MQRILFFCFLFIVNLSNAQEDHEHNKFFLFLGLGGVGGNIKESLGENKNIFSGTATALNFDLGGKIFKRTMLHGTFLTSITSRPVIQQNDKEAQVAENASMTETMFGIGATQFFEPYDIFTSASIGTGWFSYSDPFRFLNIRSEAGLAFQVKVGKGFLLAKNTSGGLALIFSSTHSKNFTDQGTEQLNSFRFGLLLMVLFN